MIPDKMLVPTVASGMKERHLLTTNRVTGCCLVVLEIIASLTCQGEIISGRFASGVERMDMFNGKPWVAYAS